MGQRSHMLVAQYRLEDKDSNGCKSYWMCLCDCGSLKRVRQPHFVSGVQKSCGCLHHRPAHNALPPNIAARNRRLNAYKMCARSKGHVWQISDALAFELFGQCCYYCGDPPSKTDPDDPSKSFVYNGIDRKDNNEGYTLENVESCCYSCNMLKRDMSHDAFLELCRKVATNPRRDFSTGGPPTTTSTKKHITVPPRLRTTTKSQIEAIP
jgi:hypothetical protein